MSAAKYDLIVIGSGPSGQRAAVAASKMKKRVAVVESRAVVGGVCINTGTIPSKTMREAVLHLSGYNYQLRLRHELPREGKDHHGRSCLPRAARDQDRGRRHRGAALAQRHRHRARRRALRRSAPTCASKASSGDTTHRRPTASSSRSAPSRPSSPKVPINGRTIINSDQVLDLPKLPRR